MKEKVACSKCKDKICNCFEEDRNWIINCMSHEDSIGKNGFYDTATRRTAESTKTWNEHKNGYL